MIFVRELGVQLAWWAIITVPRGEFRARDELRGAGLESFLLYDREVVRGSRTPRRNYRQRVAGETPRTIWDRKPKAVLTPVWPRYIFARNDADEVNVEDLQRRCRHVSGVVKSAGRALQVPERAIAALLDACGAVEEAGDVSRLSACFKGRVGDKFIIREGTPFAGFVATIVSLARLDDREKIHAWIDVLGAARPIELDYTDVGRILGDAPVVAPIAA